MRLVGAGVTVRFGSRVVFRDRYISVLAGSMVGLLGPSGSGKTTLLSVLSGALRPTEGSVSVSGDDEEVAGHRVKGRSSLQDFVSLVPQGCNSLPARSAAENVAIAALSVGTTRDVALAHALPFLDAVGLAARANSPARILSGGELQRLAVARGLASGKPFLLADEPTGNLDERNSQTVMSVLRAAADLGRGLLIATHDPIAADCCDELIRISVE